MICDLPDCVGDYMAGVCIRCRRPAYFLVKENRMVQSGGDPAYYGIEGGRLFASVDEALPFAVGTVPLDGEPFVISTLLIRDDLYAEAHFLPSDEGDWILLLDATESAHRVAQVQQNSNELSLLKIQQARMLDEIRESHATLLAILDQFKITTAIVSATGTVEFLSSEGERVLGWSREKAIGIQWRELLSVNEEQACSIETMMKRAAAVRERVRLKVELGPGRPRWFDVDVQDDPRDAERKILYIYDVSEVHDLRDLLSEKSKFHDLIGNSEPMRQVFQLIQDVSRVESTVLVEGETGTGKELTARAIHFSSARKDGPFIIVNCAGLTDSLINSQLFGHKKGAFTDAVRDQEGLFEASDGGTIFLDEIGDIPMNTQTRILRVLEQREITRIGETKQRQINIRILAATNKNLEDEVKKGNFRLDLLYRIRVTRISLPPLRERREDIPLLVESFLRELSVRTGKTVSDIETRAMRPLVDYSWPGNVRELKNALESAIVRSKGTVIQVTDLPPELMSLPSHAGGISSQDTDADRSRIVEALESTNGNRIEAAELLGISRATLYRRMKACLINPSDF